MHINMLKNEVNVNDSSYLAVNTLIPHCTEQSLDAVREYNDCNVNRSHYRHGEALKVPGG
jgi:hypothetical protein